jgi:cytochrome c
MELQLHHASPRIKNTGQVPDNHFLKGCKETMSSLEFNKIAGAVLVAGIVGFFVTKTSAALYHPEVNPKERGYQIEVAEAAPEAAAAPAGPVQIPSFLAAASVEKGASLVKPCVMCHTFEKGGANKIGPNLWGVVGAERARATGFAYSKVFTDMADKSWDFQALSEYLTKPAAYAPGNKMAFAGIAKPEDRASVLLYLNSMSDTPLPLPEAKEEPKEEKKEEKSEEKGSAQ